MTRNLRTLLAGAVAAFGLMLAAPAAYADQGSLCMPTAGVISGLTFSQDVNAGLQALVTSNSGASVPSNPCSLAPVGGQFWFDQSVSPSVERFYEGSHWVAVGALDTTNGIWLPPIGGGSGTVASASTTDLWSVGQSLVTITGTTTITQLVGSSDAVVGTEKTVVFGGSLVVTYDATKLILPGGRSILTQAGDTMQVAALGSGNVRVIAYNPIGGSVPSGVVDHFLGSTCPTNWFEPNGGTIGDASSGSSIRANADTFPVFSNAWSLDPTVSPIYTSSGSASTRGASAAADYAAHKRITILDMRGVFIRSLDDGRGVDTSRLLGSQQAAGTSLSGITASTTSTFTGNLLTSTATITTYGGVNGANLPAGGGGAQNSTSISVTGTPTGTVSSTTTLSGGAAETRGVNVALLTCVKL